MHVFQGIPGNAVIWRRLMQWPNGLYKLATEKKSDSLSITLVGSQHYTCCCAQHRAEEPQLCWLCFVLPCLRFGGSSQHRDSTMRSPLPQLLGNEDETSAHCTGSAVRRDPEAKQQLAAWALLPTAGGLAQKSLQSALSPHSHVFLNYSEIAAAVTSRTAIFPLTGLVSETDLNHTLILFQYPVPKRKIA